MLSRSDKKGHGQPKTRNCRRPDRCGHCQHATNQTWDSACHPGPFGTGTLWHALVGRPWRGHVSLELWDGANSGILESQLARTQGAEDHDHHLAEQCLGCGHTIHRCIHLPWSFVCFWILASLRFWSRVSFTCLWLESVGWPAGLFCDLVLLAQPKDHLLGCLVHRSNGQGKEGGSFAEHGSLFEAIQVVDHILGLNLLSQIMVPLRACSIFAQPCRKTATGLHLPHHSGTVRPFGDHGAFVGLHFAELCWRLWQRLLQGHDWCFCLLLLLCQHSHLPRVLSVHPGVSRRDERLQIPESFVLVLLCEPRRRRGSDRSLRPTDLAQMHHQMVRKYRRVRRTSAGRNERTPIFPTFKPAQLQAGRSGHDSISLGHHWCLFGFLVQTLEI